MLIRDANLDDFEFIYNCINELEAHCFDKEKQRRIFSENLENPALLYLIAELSGTKIGFLSCYCQQLLHHGGLVGEIQEMYVIPEFRSQKIGNKLLEKLIEIARKLNVLQIEVTSNAKREAAHNFYLKSGFDFTHKKFTFPL